MKKIIYKLCTFIFILYSSGAVAQLKQGDIIITHSPQQWSTGASGLQGQDCNAIINGTAYVVSLLHAGNMGNIPAPSGVRYTWTDLTPGNHKPLWVQQNTWVESNIGRVFGLTIEDANTFYVANTSIYSGEGNSGHHDTIWRLNPSTNAVSVAYGFPNPAQADRGIGNIKYFETGNNKYMAATWWEDGSINILWFNAAPSVNKWVNIIQFYPKFGSTKSNLDLIPYGIAIRKIGSNLKLFYGKYDLTSNTNSEVWTADLTVSGNTGSISNESTTAFISTTVKTSPNFYASVCTEPASIPISDISFSSDYSKLVLAQQGLCCSHQITAHSSMVCEYTFNPSPVLAGSLLPAGATSSSGNFINTRGTNSVGGVSYWNNILFTNGLSDEGQANPKALRCDTTVLFTSDFIYFNNCGSSGCPAPSPTEISSNFPTVSYPAVYGFQGMPSLNNYTSVQTVFDESLKVDADDDYNTMDKWNLGDIEAFNIPLDCATPILCNCNPNGFTSLTYNNTTYTTNWPNLSLGQGLASGTLTALYNCNSSAEGGCTASYNWQVLANGAPINPAIVSTTNSFNLSLLNGLPCGTYTIKVTPTCGTTVCTPKTILVKFDCPPTPCPCAGTPPVITQSSVNVTTQNNTTNTNPVSTVTTSFTLGSPGSPTTVSEVRMLIDEFRLTPVAGNDNCMLCRNKPQTWANINSATLTGVTNQTVVNPSALEKDIRELVFNNGPGTAFNLNGNVLNLTLGIPGVTGLNCCTLKAEVCVKFIIRDVNCCEREIMKCFTFNLQ